MISVMYHYVRENSKDFPNLNYLNFSNFKKQVEYFIDKYTFIDCNNLATFLKPNSCIENNIVLTFDDGFKDHYNYVFPYLVEKKINAIFYVPTGIYSKNQLLNVHKVHLLLSKIPAKTLFNDIEYKFGNINSYISNLVHDKAYLNHNDTDSNKAFKKLFNYYLNDPIKKNILDYLILKYFGKSLDNYADLFYLSTKEICEMREYGMIFGSHTVTHQILMSQSFSEQFFEIEQSHLFLNNLLNINNLSQPFNTFCFPYGGRKSFNADTINILNKLNFDFVFSVENRTINQMDLIKNKLELPRYDCNYFPFGSV